MKALILSGGSGTRLRPLTYSQQKQLIPIANKPVLFYAIEDVIEAGAKDIGIIVGPNKEQVAETVMSEDWDANIEFLYQGDPRGLAQTILVAEDFLDDDFVMYLGDNILKGGIVEHAERFHSLNPDSLVMLTQVADPQRFGAHGRSRRGQGRVAGGRGPAALGQGLQTPAGHFRQPPVGPRHPDWRAREPHPISVHLD